MSEIIDLRQIYEEAKKFSHWNLYILSFNTENEEERNFYRFVANMNLRRLQKEDFLTRKLLKEMGFKMRDTERIEPLLIKLGEAWKKHPDMRFGQFMIYFFSECQYDPFVLEDDIWLEALQSYIDEKNPKEVIDNYYTKT